MKNIALHKAFEFALDIIETYKYLSCEKKEFIMSKQLLRSGTSIGANISESTQGSSRKDFLHKINISLKEAVETKYWLELLYRSGYLNDKTYSLLLSQCVEIIKILSSSVKTTKESLG